METITFIDNRALDNGGAISSVNPSELSISDTLFVLNTAKSGGAVRLASTSRSTAIFQRCRFESNNGTRGGALRFDGEGQRIIQDSSFRRNVAGETLSSGISSVLPN